MSDAASVEKAIAAEIARGEALHRAGKLEDAEEIYRGIVERHPGKARAVTLLGTIRLQRGRAEEAVSLLEDSLRLDPRQPTARNNLGTALQALGRREDALLQFDKAISLNPRYARAYYNRGKALSALELYVQAVADFDQAIALADGNVAAHNDRANALQALGRNEEALKGFDAAIALDPGYVTAYYNRGNLLLAMGRSSDALASYEKALSLQPNHPAALNGRGNAFDRLNQRDRALESFEAAIAQRPGYALVWSNKGRVLEALGQRNRALECYEKALTFEPGLRPAMEGRSRLHRAVGSNADTPPDRDPSPRRKPPKQADELNKRANLLQRIGRYAEALDYYDRTLALNPRMASAHYNRGIALRKLGRFEEAVASYDRAIALKPDYAKAFGNRATALSKLGRREEAIASYDKAIALDPQDARAFNNRGIAQMSLLRLDDAMASFERVIALEPDSALGYWSKSHLLLLRGEFEEGWRLYEWRLKNEELELSERKFEQPQWTGAEPLEGRTILLFAEQGFGDTIQFCRYVDLVAERGADIVLEVQGSLVSLLSSLRSAPRLVAAGDPLPAFDIQASLLSLPHGFDTRLDSVPAQVPYLSADREATELWSRRLEGRKRPRVGLVWSGRAAHTNDRFRSVPIAELLPLLPCGVELIGLQKDARAADEVALAGLPGIENLGPSLSDFSDTAALIASLDLVISVDTSVAHLAGALGKPVWVMLPHAPDWRWLLDREDSPWYPTMRLFRQTAAGDWKGVVARVATALREFAPQGAAVA